MKTKFLPGLLTNKNTDSDMKYYTVYAPSLIIFIRDKPLRTKLYLSDLKIHSLPRSKHSLPLL